MCCGSNNPATTRFDNDPRVTRTGVAAFVVAGVDDEGPVTYFVLHHPTDRWLVRVDTPGMPVLTLTSGEEARGLNSADDAIALVLDGTPADPAVYDITAGTLLERAGGRS